MLVRFQLQSFSRKHGLISRGKLEEIIERKKFSLSSVQNNRPVKWDIVTLDPNKLAEKKQKCLHIGGQIYFRPSISGSTRSPVLTPSLKYDSTPQRRNPTYPPDTKAFLYYSISPGKPRISGELRLRVVSGDDPTSFERGSDLLLTDGQPWFRPLYSLSKYYLPLYEKLKEDQLIPDDLDAVLSNLPSKTIRYSRSHFLYTLNDIFMVDFSAFGLFPFIITEQDVTTLKFKGAFSDNRLTWKQKRPYTGSALARFERSTLPEHEGTRTVVLRFLKMITPVKCVLPNYDGYMCLPKEGELHRRTETHKPDSDVWSVDIDKQKKRDTLVRGFQLLWDI